MKRNRVGNKRRGNIRAKVHAPEKAQEVIMQPDEDATPEFEPRRRMISQAADLCAEQRGFQGEADFKHWLEAEAEIDSILMR